MLRWRGANPRPGLNRGLLLPIAPVYPDYRQGPSVAHYPRISRLSSGDAIQGPDDFVGAEDDREPLWFLRRGNQVVEGPRAPERHLVRNRSAHTAISIELGARCRPSTREA
jgi:hypothetical protein